MDGCRSSKDSVLPIGPAKGGLEPADESNPVLQNIVREECFLAL